MYNSFYIFYCLRFRMMINEIFLFTLYNDGRLRILVACLVILF
jgi:hypothetical protein